MEKGFEFDFYVLRHKSEFDEAKDNYMKKRFRRNCAILLCAAMILSFSACDSANGGETDIPVSTKAAETVGNGKRVYFAGPLFNQAEKDFNVEVASVLEEYGYEVFLPQRDGIEAAQLEGKSEEELIKMIFNLDSDEVKKADILFMNLDGRVPDEGACVELGIAFGLATVSKQIPDQSNWGLISTR